MSDQRYEGPPCPECDSTEYDAITDRVGECVRCGTAFTISEDGDDENEDDVQKPTYGRDVTGRRPSSAESLVEMQMVGR